ncbi:MAG: Iron utilization protein match [Dehalococcoidia bacterium]|nr:Iron utilization protein match [Dehalococcoidia bacterium]
MTIPTPAPSQRRMRAPSRYYGVEVRRIEQISPRLARVTLTSPEMTTFAPGGPADSIKVTFPAPGEEAPSMPGRDAEGRTVYAPEQERQPRRAYTIRRWDPQSLELDVDIVLHGHGPGGTWAARAGKGDRLVIADPRGAYKIDPATKTMLLAADESGLPAVATILEQLPSTTRAHVFVEVYDDEEEQAFASKAQVNLQWLHRRSDTEPTGRLLAKVLSNGGLPADLQRAWVACEAAAMREVRRHLLMDLGMERLMVQTQGYWKHGLANHSDHDWGTDV